MKDTLLAQSNDPDFPKPGTALAVTASIAVLFLIIPACGALYLLYTRHTLPLSAWHYIPIGVLIAFWPCLHAWQRPHLASVEFAVFATCIAAAASGAFALLIFGVDAAEDVLSIVPFMHLLVAGILIAQAYFLNQWRQRLRKYQSQVRLCPQCNYDLSASIVARARRCPECGYAIPLYQWDLADQALKAFGRETWQPKGIPPAAPLNASDSDSVDM